MAQLYLLSVLTLLAAGAFAASDFLADRASALAPLADWAERRSLAMTVGIAAGVVGIVKLFVRAPGDGVPVVGDLLPAIAGMATGAVVVLRHMQEREPLEGEVSQPAGRSLIEYRSPIGLAGLVVGLIHFIFPAVIIL